MKTQTENAIKCLEAGNFQGYFNALDAAEMPAHLKPIYAELKSKFMQGIKAHDFSQQLAVFAKEASGEAGLESLKNENEGTIFNQTAEKIFNIKDARGSTFN